MFPPARGQDVMNAKLYTMLTDGALLPDTLGFDGWNVIERRMPGRI